MFNEMLITEWHPTKNGSNVFSDFKPKSNKKAWWQDALGHEWETTIANRTSGKNCPYCAGNKILSGFNDLTTSNPKLAEQWDTNKNIIKPSEVSKGSNQKIYWIHPFCNHEWQQTVKNRVNSSHSCPICSNQILLQGFNDLATIHPELVKEWHPTKNGLNTPNNFLSGSDQKIWWKDTLGHEWETKISNRTKKDSNSCPICANNQILSGFNDLAFLKPEITKLWHPTKNGELKPNHVGIKSAKKVWWLCEKGHETLTRVYSYTVSGGTCSICSGRQLLKGTNDLASTHPELIQEWHPTKNGSKTSETITYGHDDRIWWICEKGHEWATKASNRAIRKQGCPTCWKNTYSSKAEKEIVEFLKKLLPDETILTQDKKLIYPYFLDIYLPNKRIAIEYNGVYWHSEYFLEKDAHHRKWSLCKDKNVQLIQIWEDEWNYNKELIKQMLAYKLKTNDSQKIAARKTYLNQIEYFQASTFLQQNHIQHEAKGSHYLALKDKNTDEIVAVMVLKKEPDNNLNIVRFATSKTVMGGFTKLLKNAEKMYKPNSFITFSDNSISDGALYQQTGFIKDKEISPDYMYVVKGQRQHKFGYRLKRFKNDPNLQHIPGLTEHQLAQLNNLPRIYDAGKIKWVKNIQQRETL